MNNRGPQVLAVAIVFFITTWSTLILRFYVRTRLLRHVGSDDWMVAFAQLIFTCYLGCQISGVVYGTGRHIWDLELDRARLALKSWWLCELFYVQSTCWAKIAVGVFLLKLAKERVHRWIIYGLMIGDIIFCQTFLFIILFQCIPISGFWERAGGAKIAAKCIDPRVIVNTTYAASAVNSVADFAFAALPILIIRNVQMERRNRILVSTVLAMGAIASIATIVRIPYIKYLADLYDFLWSTTDTAIWSTIEPGLGMTAANAATLRPLLRTMFGDSNPGRDSTRDHYTTKKASFPSLNLTHNRTVDEDEDGDELVHNPTTSGSDTIYTADSGSVEGHKLRTIWVETEVRVQSQGKPQPIDHTLQDLWSSPSRTVAENNS